MNQGFLYVLARAARLAGQGFPSARTADAERVIHSANPGISPHRLLTAAWSATGLQGKPHTLEDPTPADLPCVGHRSDLGWFLLVGRNADGSWRMEAPEGAEFLLESLTEVSCISLPRRSANGSPAPSAVALVWNAILKRKAVFLEAILATAFLSILALTVSLYSMQVYDRVIPNQGFQTLWVLTFGVAVAILLEFVLKQLRSHIVDRTGTVIDHELSEWFFKRMLNIRMEKRPSSVGTLASQLKGFEMVRGVLTSTSMFILADVPFSLFFILVIGLIGGVIVFVPLIALPLALIAGLIFQRTIEQHTRANQVGSNLKTGLLVEAVDGAESLKANHGEWNLQGRWNRLVKEVGDSDQKIRFLSALSQNMTAGLQQLGYVTLVASGAWLVTQNELTMGGLLACSIIANRAMMPVVQLPGVMVQWAHARAAIEGLDRIIELPSESDEEHQTLVPGALGGSYRFERTRFAYGKADTMALEVENLQIRPGEKVGLLGSIGSGKSTLLKLASGLYRPQEGKVFLGDIDMALLAPSVVRETVGYLPQDQRLFSGTLRENLILGLADPGDEAILDAAKQTGLIQLIAGQSKGLALEITEGGRGVSGGQRQLIGMTRLLLGRQKVWILDEPTGSMDADSEARLVNLLRTAIAKEDTLLVATHKTALLPLLDRLIVMHGGRVKIDGPRDKVLAHLSGKPQV